MAAGLSWLFYEKLRAETDYLYCVSFYMMILLYIYHESSDSTFHIKRLQTIASSWQLDQTLDLS